MDVQLDPRQIIWLQRPGDADEPFGSKVEIQIDGDHKVVAYGVSDGTDQCLNLPQFCPAQVAIG